MTDRLALPRRYRDQLEALLREHVPGVEVWAYGSRVNGRSHDGSDLDLALRGPTLEPLDGGFYDLREAIEKSNIPILVQAHDWAMLPESFHREIERDYVVVQDKQAKPTSDGATEKSWLYQPEFPDYWDRRPLYCMASWVNGLAFRNIQFSPTGKPIIKIAEIKGGISGQTKFTQQAFDESVRVRPGDLLFSWSGQPETSIDAFWWHGPEGWLNQHVFRVTTGTGVDTTFFYYLLRYLKPNFVGIARNKQTTGLGHVTRRDLENMEAAIPPLPEQRAIAHVLGTLDDKIELNRRRNETLEAMARALFKSWFVDFEPVQAKMEGRWRRGESLPGLPAEHYDLFPERLVDSELGVVPEGWEVKALGDCIDVERGLSYKGSGLSSSGVPMHNLNSIHEGGRYKEDGIKYYNGDYQARHVAHPGDLLVANTEQGHDRLLIGFAAVIPKRFGDNGLFSHHIYRVCPKSPSVLSPDFLCQLLNTQVMHDTVSGYATGTTVNMLPVDALRIPSIVVPTLQLVAAFGAVAGAIRTRQEQLIVESFALDAQRNTLLPMLLSGEVRI